MDLKTKAKEIISNVKYVTIATASENGEPWNTPVLAGYDDTFNFYWTSWKGTQHSKNIHSRPDVFIVIYDSSIPADTGGCVYIKAKANELTDAEEIRHAAYLRYQRKNQSPRNVEDFLHDAPRRMYKATPEHFWVSIGGSTTDITQSREEIQLP